MLSNISGIKDELKKRLKDASLAHCQNVADNAAKIAARFGLDENKLYISGLLHDVAAEMNEEDLLRIANDNDVRITENEEKKPHWLHGKVGAILARDIFGIYDEDIISAISNHSGVPDMTEFEKALFTADGFVELCESGAAPSMEELLKCGNLDAAILYLVGVFLKSGMDNGEELDPDYEMTFDYIIEMTQREFNAMRDIRKWVESRMPLYPDEFFDKLVKVHLDHATGIESVTNMRDLGGYDCIYDPDIPDGQEALPRRVRKHMLIRSAYLGGLTEEDAKKLYDMGINYVIDFRGEADQKKMPDRNIEIFKHVTCDLSTLEKTKHQKDVKGVKKGLDPEKYGAQAWVNVEYLKEFDVQKMYKDIYLNDDTRKALKKFLDTLMSDDCTGAVMHCRDGKDRTGVAVALLLMLLGVSEEDIRLDYMASTIPNYATVEIYRDAYDYYDFDKKIISNSLREKSVDMEVFDSVGDWMIKKYKNSEGFLDEVLGEDFDFVRKLREKFTERI